MPSNKHAAIRYRAIDRQLVLGKRPSLEDLAEACKEALEVDKIGIRTISKDLEDMRHDPRLGFRAPIKYNQAEKFYYYEDPTYSITKFPLNKEELTSLSFVANLLDQFKDIGIFETYKGAVDKVVRAIRVGKLKLHYPKYDFIGFEKVTSQGGTKFLNPLIDAILHKQVISIQYQRFGRDKPWHHVIHPYYLKEYRNLWYLIGRHDKYEEIRVFALDRMVSVDVDNGKSYIDGYFDADDYFKDSVGIIARMGEPVKVRLSFTKSQAAYLLAQPIHDSQIVEDQDEDRTVFSLNVLITHELESAILSWGDQVKVLEPESLAEVIRERHQKAFNQYGWNTET